MRRSTIFLAGLFTLAAPATMVHSVSANAPAQVIEIKAKKYEFSPTQLTLKKGETVTLHLTSEDRVHGFFQRALNIDSDIAPGKVTEVTVTPTEAGSYTVICDHYCGLGHGNMNMTIKVE